MKVEFRRSFAEDLKDIKDKALLNRVKKIIETVEKADTLAEVHGLKKLRGSDNYFRIRIGDYRIGIAFENESVIFVRILNRKDIYKYFP